MVLLIIFLIPSQTSWSQASKKQREKLLELIRRLAEDDKDGVMAHKVCPYTLKICFEIFMWVKGIHKGDMY